VTGTWDSLMVALMRFLEDAAATRDMFRDGGTLAQPPPEPEAVAAQLARLPSAEAAGVASIEAAKENGYLLREPSGTSESRLAGRRLSAKVLVDTGVTGLLLSGGRVDVPTLAAELAGYLAGPVVPLWDYAIVDADLTLSGPVPVVDGWELVTPTSEELASLVGVPSAAQHVTRRSFNLDLYAGLAMLRRIDPQGKPHGGLLVSWNMRPAHALWQPMLAMSLYQNPVVHLWAQYNVEPGRRVDVLFDHVYTEPWTPDGETEVEIVRAGDYEIDAVGEPRFRRFLELLAPLLDTAVAQPAKPTKASRERAARVRRIAEHFLTSGEDAHGEGEVLSEFNADAVLHYVIALEAVLAGNEKDKTELTRKVVQRAAILAGIDDSDRLAVATTVRAAYGARSAYAHGSEPANIDLPELRRVVRDCVLARLILGDPISNDSSLAALADSALLDHELLADQVRGPISAFWTAVDLG
jgi:hypothetical protein